MTPEKYYPYRKGEQGQIRLLLTPGFKKKVQALTTQDPEKNQGFFYIIRQIETRQPYVGTSCDPERRCKEHGYAAEYGNPESEKYDPDQLTGQLHPAMGVGPGNFEVGLLPIYDASQIPPNEGDQFDFISGIANVECYLMQAKKSLISQGGLNCIQGGGPVADPLKQRARFAKRLF